MYKESVPLYDLIYAWKDYRGEAAWLHERIQQIHPRAHSLLDIACGTGRHLEHLNSGYHVEGLDLNPQLLERARQRCPGAELHLGNMIDFSLGRAYDVVTCLFSSIGYTRTVTNMRRAVASMASHLRRPGVLLIEPFFTPDNYWREHVVANFYDEPNLKLAWLYRHDSRDDLAVLDFHYLVADPDTVEHFVERHEFGLFSRQEMEGAFADAGLEVQYEENERFRRGLYTGYLALE